MAGNASVPSQGSTGPEGIAPGRRRFITITLVAIATVTAGIIGVPLAGFFALPALKRLPRRWLEVGEVSTFEEGQIKKVLAKPVTPQVWPQATPSVAIYVLNQGGEKFTLFHIHCSHVGCPIQWNVQANRFFCPCHGAVFDTDGRVLAGPLPRPLDRYEYKIDSGILYAGQVYTVNEQLEFVSWQHT